MGRLLLACFTLLASSCAGTDRGLQPDGRWPDQDDPGSQYVSASVFADDATVSFEMFPVMSLRDGTLVRCYCMPVESTATPSQCFTDFGVVRMESTESFGGGVGRLAVRAAPRAGLTWGDVGDEGDLVIDVMLSPEEPDPR